MRQPSVYAYFRRHRAGVLVWLLFTAGVSFFAPLKSFQLKWLIDAGSKAEAFRLLGLVFAVTFLSWSFETLSRRAFTRLACGAAEQVRGQVVERLLHRSAAQYNQEGDAAYLSLLTTDLRTLYDDVYMSLFNFGLNGGILLCALGLYLYISPVLLAAILLVTVLPLALPRVMNRRLKQARDRFSMQMAAYTHALKELLGGFEVIRGFLREDAYAAQHREAARSARQGEQDYQQSLNSVTVNTSLISNLIFPVILMVGLVLVFDGRITLGTMSTAASMANFVITPCHQIAQNAARLRSAQGIRTRLEAAMAAPRQDGGGAPLGRLERVECRGLGFAYPGAAQPVLHDVQLALAARQKIALVGESGCGKSTLAKLLFQYYPDYTGSIRFNGQELRALSRTALYRRVGYIAQSTYLFEATLRSNLCLREDFSDAQVWAALRAAGLAAWAEALPEGLETIIRENGKNLSGGQRQRIGIARLALRQYDLILADEVTASLDPATARQVTGHLLSMPCMVVAITHDCSPELLARFDRVYRVAGGTLAPL